MTLDTIIGLLPLLFAALGCFLLGRRYGCISTIDEYSELLAQAHRRAERIHRDHLKIQKHLQSENEELRFRLRQEPFR